MLVHFTPNVRQNSHARTSSCREFHSGFKSKLTISKTTDYTLVAAFYRFEAFTLSWCCQSGLIFCYPWVIIRNAPSWLKVTVPAEWTLVSPVMALGSLMSRKLALQRGGGAASHKGSMPATHPAAQGWNDSFPQKNSEKKLSMLPRFNQRH